MKDANLPTTKIAIRMANVELEQQDQQSSTTESELCRNAGLSAFQLQETSVLQRNRIRCKCLVITTTTETLRKDNSMSVCPVKL